MITVTVSGLCGTGKSTVAYLIANQLLQIGFNVGVEFLDGENMDDVSQNIIEKMQAVHGSQNIRIVEKSELIIFKRTQPKAEPGFVG